MTFERLIWSLAFLPFYQEIYLGYTYRVSFLFLTIVFRMSDEYMDEIEYDRF